MSIFNTKVFRGVVSAITASAVTLSSLVFITYAEEAQTPVDTVTVFTTNDIHGVVGGDGTVGMDTLAAVKASTSNSLLVDAGDATQGASFATVSLGEDVIRVMNAADYDLMVPGNHEFDYGIDQLLANDNAADFDFISANVTYNGDPLFTGSKVFDVNGHSLGFIGLTTADTATSTNPTQLNGVEFTDEVKAAEEAIAQIADKTDAIILVGHMGNNSNIDSYTSEELLDGLSAESLSEVTAFVDGHSHTVEETVFEKNGAKVPVVQTGTGFVNMGRVTVSFDENGVASADVDVLTAEEVSEYPLTDEGKAKADEVNEVLAEISGKQQEILGKELCQNDTPLWGGYVYYDYAEPRIVETNYGDFVTDAFASYGRRYAEKQNLDMPVIGVENGGGVSSTLPYGTVTRGDVLNAFNHGNTVTVLQVSPYELFLALESGLAMTGQDETGLLIREKVSGSFLQVSGLVYTYDPAGESNRKVTSVVLDDGTVLDRNDNEHKLILVTNSYVAAWFDAEDKLGELGGEDYIVERYLLELTEDGTKPLSVPTDGGRIKIANDKSPDTYELSVPVYDASTLTATPGGTVTEESKTLAGRIVNVRIDDASAVEYVTDQNGMINLILAKGPHTLYLEESADDLPVYVNNYSGSGVSVTAEGYFRLGFAASADLPVYEKPTEPDGSENGSQETEKPQTNTSEADGDESSAPQSDTTMTDTTKTDASGSGAPAAKASANVNTYGDNPNTGAGASISLSAILVAAFCGLRAAKRRK